MLYMLHLLQHGPSDFLDAQYDVIGTVGWSPRAQDIGCC